MGGPDTGEWLNHLAGDAKRVRLNARTAAELVTNMRCSARRALDVARIDKSVLAKQLGFEQPRGQSPFAISRGKQFERAVKRDEYLQLLDLLRPLGLDTKTLDIVDLRDDIPFVPSRVDEVLAERANRTREAVVEIANGTAPPGRLIDGGALEWTIGGTQVRLEADAIAWWLGGKLHVIEVKSFPIEWGQVPAEKVTAASWQTAVYVAALQDLLTAAGFDPALISTEIFLVCPRNTGLKPDLVVHDVAPQLRLLRQHENREAPIDEIAARAGAVTVDMSGIAPEQRADLLAAAIERLGPVYQPNCLSTCELAPYCRSRAQATGNPAVMGGEVLQVSIGVGDLRRAASLVDGSTPKGATEVDFAALAADVRRVEGELLA